MPTANKKPVICCVTDRKTLDSNDPLRSVLDGIHAALVAGVDWVQIREKDLPARELATLVREAVVEVENIVPPRTGKTRVIVNDRLDVAIAAGAGGVHLGGESVPVTEVVRWCRDGNAPLDFAIGVSCHSLEQTKEAATAGASYIFFGPVFDTPSKKPFGPPQGIARLKEICAAVQITVIAIGGINEKNAADCIRAGATGVAAIRMFQETADPRVLAEKIARLHG